MCEKDDKKQEKKFDLKISVEGLKSNKQVPICKYYFADKKQSVMIGGGISVIIIVVNGILKTSIIMLIQWVGEDTYSEQLSSITNGVFYAQFFNTGLLLLLVNANMTEHKPSLITSQIDNQYYDYSPDWYADVGQKLFQTMIIQSILPYVTLTTGFIIPRLKAYLDNDFTGDVYKTKTTGLAQYINLYSGTDYVIHFKYSTVLNVVYITMMYGVGMPMLFPLAAFNFFNQWITERIIVAYQVRLPPALDDKLTNNCISMLKGAPLLLLFNGYWMISNRQIFSNAWSYKERSFETMKSGHVASLEVNWATPMLLLAGAAVIIISIQLIFKDVLMKYGFAMSSKKIQVDEDLPRFFESIKLRQADELISEQFNMKKNYGFIPNDPDTIKELDKV